MRIKIRQQAPGFIFTPNHPYHRVSKSSEFHQLETGEVYEYSTSKKISLLDMAKLWRETRSAFPSFKIIFHLPPLKLVAHSDIVKHEKHPCMLYKQGFSNLIPGSAHVSI